jgi:septum formation protein
MRRLWWSGRCDWTVPVSALGLRTGLSTGLFHAVSLVLASSSAIRRALLDQAGVEYRVEPPDVDEDPIQAAHEGQDFELALALAEAKALAVSAWRPGDWVIGGDSVISVEGRRFSKPGSRDEAADHLRFFSSKAMRLVSAVALAKDGSVDWNHIADAVLHVRPLSEAFIAEYLDAEWPEVSYCVGVFRMEGRGVTLFDQVEGDHFTILGMPLLPLLAALRERGIAAS